MQTRSEQRETVFQIALLMAMAWALCWLFLHWEVPASWFPPVTQQQMNEARKAIKQ